MPAKTCLSLCRQRGASKKLDNYPGYQASTAARRLRRAAQLSPTTGCWRVEAVRTPIRLRRRQQSSHSSWPAQQRHARQMWKGVDLQLLSSCARTCHHPGVGPPAGRATHQCGLFELLTSKQPDHLHLGPPCSSCSSRVRAGWVGTRVGQQLLSTARCPLPAAVHPHWQPVTHLLHLAVLDCHCKWRPIVAEWIRIPALD